MTRGTAAAKGEPAPEVELTLAGNPAALERGWRTAVSGDADYASHRLRSTYYDTRDFRLRRCGFTLRIREDGERLVQTLKSKEPFGPGLILRRQEWSRPVETPLPSLPFASDPSVHDAVGTLGPAELAPVFCTDVMRRAAKVEVATPDRGIALVEVALDNGEIRAQGKRDAVSELEIELIHGPASALYEFAIALQGSASFRIQTASKAKRGYVLAGAEGYTGHKAPALALEPGISVDSALRAIFLACADHCAANLDAVLDGDDPEGVHQFRVALRRLRSVLSTFRSVLSTVDLVWLEREAKLLIDLLGPARDWDVFVTETLAAVRAARPDDKTLVCLAAAADAQRERAYKRAEALRDPEFTTFLLRFGRWTETAAWQEMVDPAVLDQPFAGLAGRLLDERHERVLKRGRGFENLSDSRLHRLRIVLKKLRYPCEFFAGQFPESKSNLYIRAARGLQGGLGRLNDAAVAERRLTALLRDHRKSGDLGALSVAAGQVIGWHARVCKETRTGLAEDWRAFAALRPFWRAPEASDR